MKCWGIVREFHSDGRVVTL